MIVTTDDLCPENLQFFSCWGEVKKRVPWLRLIVFVVANYGGKQDVSKSEEFKKWHEGTKDWVTVGVHGYDHSYPPEQERGDAKELVEKSLEILREFLPSEFLYRPPGFQRTIHTELMLKELGFAGVAYQARIKMFNGVYLNPVFNTHCCDRYKRPVTEWKKWIGQIS